MGIFRNLLLICSPDPCVKEMRDSYVRIGIPKDAKDEEGRRTEAQLISALRRRRPRCRECFNTQKNEQRLSKLLLKTAQSSLNVIKPSRSVNARKTSRMRSNKGESTSANFRRDRF